MKKILFVCLGNICRSPMAEAIMNDLIKKQNYKMQAYSAGTSGYHNGERPHAKTLSQLKKHNIETSYLISTQLQKEDYKKYDYIVGMDENNIKEIYRILQIQKNDPKIFKLLEQNIPDPWYSGNFEETYDLCLEGCSNLIKKLITK